MSGPDGPRAALLEAMDLLRAGRLDEAEPILRRVLAAQPDQPDALHLLGLWHHERGDTNEAQRLIIEAIRVWPAEDPQRCVAWNNLGNVLVEDGRLEAAVATYRSALAAQPSASGTWTNLAGLLRRLGRGGEAEDAARRAVEAGPGDAQAWFTLSRVLVERGALPEGLEAHARGVALAPRDVVGREQVLQSLALLGRRDEAAALWGEWRRERPDDPVAEHHEAACLGSPPSRASAAYVRAVFDGFATTFDAKLAKLHYRAPALIVDALADLGGDGRWDTVADLGCGTGLVGALLRGRARWLVGVDLSAGMLEHAQRRHVYDEVIEADLVAYLRGATRRFDVVVAADVLCYFGVLDDVIAAATAALCPGGILAFTVEAQDASTDADWSLAMTGRYAHARRYVEAAMACFDDVVVRPDVLRTEAGRPVDGLVVTGRTATGSHPPPPDSSRGTTALRRPNRPNDR